MNKTEILMSKEQRMAMLDRIDVLNKVKALFLLPGLSMITAAQAAEYFEVSLKCVHMCYDRNREELSSNGAMVLTPTQLKERLNPQNVELVGSSSGQLVCIDNEGYFEMPNRGCRFFTPRALLNLAMLLTESPVAREIRNQLLNIADNASAEIRVAAIEDEQALIMELGQAIAAGDLQAVIAAQTKYNEYKNRHLAAAQERIDTLVREKEALAAEKERLTGTNAALEDTNATLTDENAALLDANTMLAEQALAWDARRTLNALIRALAAAAYNGKYSRAWDYYYRELKYQEGICLLRRISRSGEGPLDTVKDGEWPKLLKVAASVCYEFSIDVRQATNEATVQKYNLDTVETAFGVRKNRGMRTWKATDDEINRTLRRYGLA